MQRHYKGTIWTDHALERLKQRQIKQSDAWAALYRPDSTRYASTKQAWIYYRTWANRTVEVVAKQNEHKEWIILSVWDKPNNGSSKPPPQSFLSAIWNTIKWLISRGLKLGR